MVRVAGYLIDCALEERLTYEAEVTSNPIEKGSDFTDHVQRKRPVLELEGLVSDTPIGRVKIETSRTELTGTKPSADAFRRFVEVYEAGVPVVVECTYGRFENMLLETLTPTRDSQSARAFKFTATFRQIKIIENKRVSVLVPRAATKVDRGFQVPRSEEGWLGLPTNVPYVVSYPSSERFVRIYHDMLGMPLLTTTHAERVANNAILIGKTGTMDHYRIKNDSIRPDGWVQNGKFFTLGEGVTYKDAEKSWEKGGRRITRQPPPVAPRAPAEDDDEKVWFGVTRGKARGK